MKQRFWIIVGAGVALLVAAALLWAYQGWQSRWTSTLLLAGGGAWTLAVALSWREMTRWLHKRSARYGLNAFVQSFLVMVILALVGFLADRHSARVDLTSTQEFSLSDKSLKVLQGIRQRIDVHVFFDRSTRDAARDLLDEYTRRNRLIRVHMDDLNKDPEQAERYGVNNFGTIVFDNGEKVERIGILAEEDVTNALIKVSRPGKKRVYFLSDHGEKDIASRGIAGYATAAEALRRENYDPQVLSLRGLSAIPPDCEVLVVAGAKSRLLTSEVDAIQRYLQTGHRAMFLFDPRFSSGLEDQVMLWGVRVGNDRIVDTSPTGQLLGRGALVPLVSTYGVHPITKQFGLPTYFEQVRSVRVNNLYNGRAEVTALAFTGNDSWADVDVDATQVKRGDPGDEPGPVPFAVAVRLVVADLQREMDPAMRLFTPGQDRSETLAAAGAAAPSEARLVVVGDSDFANNRNFPDMGNGNFFLNCVAWLAQDEDLIAVRPRDADRRAVGLTKAEVSIMNLLAIGLLPGFVAAAGVFVTLRRRARG